MRSLGTVPCLEVASWVVRGGKTERQQEVITEGRMKGVDGINTGVFFLVLWVRGEEKKGLREMTGPWNSS